MRVWAQYLTRREAAEVARDLTAAGYAVTVADCRNYAGNVVDRVGGADPEARREVNDVIARVLDDLRAEGNTP